ncbi:MAG: hypothetical protein GEU98_14070 [Pseudonocardiaceae bacterium]|nr:hypothetical protein [Pseudonocardiaceae bacterium]
MAVEGWFDNVTDVVKDIGRDLKEQLAYKKALADAKASAETIAVDPDVGDAVIKQLTEVHDIMSEIAMKARFLGEQVPLGGGYAEIVGKFMAQFGSGGEQSVDAAMKKGQQDITQLIEDVRQAMVNYQQTDASNADAFK